MAAIEMLIILPLLGACAEGNKSSCYGNLDTNFIVIANSAVHDCTTRLTVGGMLFHGVRKEK